MGGATIERRLKFWGWGYEDQQPPHDESRSWRRASAQHLGFGAPDVERAGARSRRWSCPPPRIEPPGVAGAICSSGPYDRALALLRQGLPRRRARVPGQFDHPPDVVARPRGEDDVERRARRGAPTPARSRSRSAAARAWSAASSRAWPTTTPARSPSTCSALDRVLEVDRDLARGAHPGGRHRPVLEEQLKRARAHASPLPAVVRVRDARRLDRDPGRRPLRHPPHPHRRPGRVGARDHAARGVGEPPAARHRAPVRSPDRMLLGSEGILGVITEAWMRLQDRPRWQGVRQRRLRPTSRPGREAVRALSQSGLSRRTAGCSTRARQR